MAINPNERFNRVTVGRGRAANRNRTQGSGKLAGTTNSVYQANLQRQNQNKRRGFGDVSGLLSGLASSGNPGQFGEAEVADLGAMRDEIYNKTTIDVTGVGYNNKFDKDGNLISNLTGVNEDVYNQSGDLTTMFGNQMKDYNSGGFEAMEQRRLERMRALTSEDNERRAQQIKERDQNTGASLYQQYYNSRAEGDRLNREDLGFQNNAYAQAIQGGNYLSNQRAGTQNSMIAATGGANTMLANQMANVDATTGYDLEADAITGMYNQKAVAANSKANSKNKFWGSLLEFGGNAIMPGAGTVAKGLFT